ncbi:hypothetical protein HIM_09734 [Hirsutella minnesotensis 3608]|uniref:Uncharacterized protein n=1 Tax=Hirsutella minnesotensis 3608 TaxID=1043627 RepID=A0A0F8A2Y1_9HYPO|nr:hypothetical protein HIM_09734 [Hirsutella minnesotensis 3608]
MKLLQTLAISSLATFSTASPLNQTEIVARKSLAGCYIGDWSDCCVPKYCKCRNGGFFKPNPHPAGSDACDPPGDYMSHEASKMKGYCCRGKQQPLIVVPMAD